MAVSYFGRLYPRQSFLGISRILDRVGLRGEQNVTSLLYRTEVIQSISRFFTDSPVQDITLHFVFPLQILNTERCPVG